MVESTYASDSPRSRSPMTEPSSPLHSDGPGISGYGHSYLYSYSPEHAQNHVSAATRRNNQNETGAVDAAHERTFARSPIGTEETTMPRHRGHGGVREPIVPSRSATGTSAATMSSPTSLFTIDSILAPRPIGNIVAPTSTTTVAASVIQTPETIESAAGRTTTTAAMHPLQQQLHHLAFTSADFLGG